jgi:F0F1-type ATP synthase assembly protein I
MMRNVIAALVAGFLILAWQTASHTFLELHAVQEKYTPNHAGILKMLGDSLGGEGQYFLPGVPPGTSFEEMEKMTAATMGKPWAQVSYHNSMDMNMTSNLLRGFGTNIIVGFVLVWLLGKMKNLTFSTTLIASLAVGFIAFCVHPYPTYIWYKTPGINMELLDSLVSFGLAGLWLGWFLNRKKV